MLLIIYFYPIRCPPQYRNMGGIVVSPQEIPKSHRTEHIAMSGREAILLKVLPQSNKPIGFLLAQYIIMELNLMDKHS